MSHCGSAAPWAPGRERSLQPLRAPSGAQLCRDKDSPPPVPKYRALTTRHTPISVPRKELRGGTSACSLEEETSAQTQGTFQQTSTSFPGSGVLRFALLTSFFKFTFLGISQMMRLSLHHIQPSFLHLFHTPHRPLGLMITFCCCCYS